MKNTTPKIKYFILSAIMFFSVTNYAVTWKGAYADWYYSQNNLAYVGYQHYEKVGDTLINGILCDNIRCTVNGYSYMTSSYVSSSHSVYTYVVNDTVMEMTAQPNVLYIANAAAGATWPVKYTLACNNAYFVVDSTENSIMGGTPVRYIYGSYFQDSTFYMGSTIIEGIGDIFGLIPEAQCVIDNDWFELRCFNDSDSLYYNSGMVPRCDFINSVNELQWENIRLFPNPAETDITIDLTSIKTTLEEVEIFIHDLTGNVILYRKPDMFAETIDVSQFPDGYYFIELKKEGRSMRNLEFVKVRE